MMHDDGQQAKGWANVERTWLRPDPIDAHEPNLPIGSDPYFGNRASSAPAELAAPRAPFT